MLTAREKRFIRSWEEQREGGKWSYFLLYTLLGTFIGTLILSIFLFLFFYIVFGSPAFWAVLLGTFLFSAGITLMNWHTNERKLRDIIRREVREGRLSDFNEQAVKDLL